MGELFLAEIREQPMALRRLLEHRDTFGEVGRALRERAPDVVRLVGHGSSDNAASYGVYAFGLLPGWTAMRDSISLSVYYDAQLDMSRSVVLGLSQSGRTPDVVEYLTRARARGALTVAITNEPEAELARAADLVLPLAAGEERAVAATKTYLNQVAALALIAACAAERCEEFAENIAKVADLLESALPDMERSAREVGVAFAYVGRMYVIGRGIEFATAREIAIKLTETCRVAAEPLTSTDLAHGPIAALDPLFPVWAIASPDRAFPAVVEAARRAREAGATLVASGSAAAQIEGAAYILPAPKAPDLLLTPLLSVVPGQLVANALAQAKGLDADRPIGLTKVTLAQ
jgi:glucosamine--fructose-6-phosphate aminotransferase (isomerizing)